MEMSKNMKKKIIVLLLIACVVALLLLSTSFSQKTLLNYQSYTLERIDVSNEEIIIEGGFGGASGIGCDGFDYTIENDAVYLEIYQQSLFTRKPLNGTINIKLFDDFSKISGIYLVQTKGEPVKVWPKDSINH